MAPFNCDMNGPGTKDCGADHATKCGMHCGWIDRSEWTEEMQIGELWGCPVRLADVGICPGWLARQPAVEEAKLATYAFEKGSLAEVFPRQENTVVDAAIIGSTAWKQYEAHEMKRMRDKQ